MEIRPVLNKEEIQSLQVLKKERVDMSWNPAVNYLGAYVGGGDLLELWDAND